MTPAIRPALLALLLGCALTAGPALAQDIGQHPAVFAPRKLPGIDPNTFIVGHPASPRTRAGHANSEHPAVQRWAAPAHGQVLDANTFLVQPPASVHWVQESAGPAALALAAAPAAPGRPAN